MDIPSQFPEVNRAERDRLLARADAAEERLLRRMQVESAERIARDDRLAREASLREALARREAEQAAAPGILLIQPFRAPRAHRAIRRPPRQL